MKTKLLALLAQLQGMAATLQVKGVCVGLVLGFLGHPMLKVAVDAAMLLVKGVLKI
jgi:hypothetical protein